jgi:hypothetical protein
MSDRRLTPIEQDAAVALLPIARAVASRWGRDDEYQSAASLAVCQAVSRWRPEWGISLQTHAWRRANAACSDLYNARRRERTNANLSDVPSVDPAPDLSEVIPDRLRPLADLRSRGLSPRECAGRLRMKGRRVDRMLRELEECLR